MQCVFQHLHLTKGLPAAVAAAQGAPRWWVAGWVMQVLPGGYHHHHQGPTSHTPPHHCHLAHCCLGCCVAMMMMGVMRPHYHLAHCCLGCCHDDDDGGDDAA